MDNKEKRNFYRQQKESIDWYLAQVDKTDYAFMYRLLGNPGAFKFVHFEKEMAEDILKVLRLHFSNKMKELE